LKKIIISLTAVIFFFLLTVNHVHAEGKFGFVDLSKVFDEYQKTKDYDSKLEKEQEQKQKDREKKIKEIKDLQSKASLLNDKAKEKTQEKIDKKIKSLQEFDRQTQTDLRRQRDKFIKEILKEIEKTISDHAKKENYTIVFNDRILLYGNETLDLTDPILNSLNSKYSKIKR